ncbi:DEAD/DEAH box helicase [Citrobacter sp. 50677481]|uniref:DEAD/DEAH box helicase n=1 Tax=Citrobacter sp. 50677481 TaxID=1736699 RepID=UPI00074223DD|nr:DEAD/DEAH box helicase [Citrobacter sp. 50677481]EBW6823756.1 ATP-dependent helicase [Salmonella enterica subsp. enterica serovar Senftenberg]HCI4171303.1 DEAD/DEAH box helicase [Salmonella enterica]HCQ7757224.1 DEAD/DEAH box helicase [Citrobacter sedlakii]EDD5670788.1 ATP-dependent helicase [Salmonella enterica subsp. enterica serovar Senftenberg]KSY30994.1 helicase [Citrobacter sp. 50677481]
MLNLKPKAKQVTGLQMLHDDWNNYRTFLLYAPVGYGKTFISAYLADKALESGKRTMFVAPYLTLVRQTADRFIQYGIPEDEISYVWRDFKPHDPERLIQIASADTLIRREFPDNIDLLIVDEAHMKRRGLLEVIRDSDIKVVGLSGTPFSPWMGQYYERLIKPTTMKELIQIGDLSPYEFYAPTTPDLKGVKTSAKGGFGRDFDEDQLAKIMGDSTLVGDIVQNWLQNGENRPTVCFCVNQSHAGFITTEFNRAGVSAEIMIDVTPPEERRMIIHRFEQGATKIIVNVGVLTAGFDSDVRCIIYARPTKSEMRWLQVLGRGLRTAPGKDHCLIFDHSGSIHRLGYPDDIEYDELPGKSDGMNAAVSRNVIEKTEKKPKECSQCHYIKPAGVYVCPKCGFKPIGGENVETDSTRKLQRLSRKEKIYTRSDKQSWWSQIKGYQRQRAMKGKPLSDGWCAHTFRDKFGEWPNGLSNFPIETGPEVWGYIKSKFIAFSKSRGAA